MELWKEILFHALAEQPMEITFPALHISPERLLELRCYQALKQIKTIIEDDTLDDPSCFEQIEAIVLQLEALGSDGGFRHDFG